MHPLVESSSLRRLRVLVADDHPVVRTGVVSLLEREADLTVVCEAANGEEAVAGWQTHMPDVGLIDISMPVLDGFSTVTAIRRIVRKANVVIMSTFCGGEDVYRALHVGASGYLLKDCGRQEWADCIRAVARGQKYLQAAAAARLAERVIADNLTAREADVLHCLSQGLSNKAIARCLGVAEGTVKTHMKGVLDKLQVSSRTQAVRLALQRGLVHLPEPGSEDSDALRRRRPAGG